ncbi:hypothetical protein GW17_00037604 [Ensete ventricosum]|nr:hypothetical protein GW17_00037604 [Ensete ventricosum]
MIGNKGGRRHDWSGRQWRCHGLEVVATGEDVAVASCSQRCSLQSKGKREIVVAVEVATIEEGDGFWVAVVMTKEMDGADGRRADVGCAL